MMLDRKLRDVLARLLPPTSEEHGKNNIAMEEEKVRSETMVKSGFVNLEKGIQ